MEGRLVYIFLALLFEGNYAVESLKFLAIGDWGGIPYFPYDTPIETAVARQMAKITELHGSSFNLALGDNFYSDGVVNVDDKRFHETFEKVYHYKSLQNPWYLVAGNHDHYGNASAQIAYSKKSPRWNFPDYYYKLSFPIAGSAKSVDIVMIDTVLLCGNTAPDYVGDQPHGPKDFKASTDELSWIDLTLSSSTADYLIVAGHFPVYSIGEHGPTQCLLDKLKPLLFKYNVTAYLAGHDHNLQHLQTTENGRTVNYFVTGAANFVGNSQAHAGDVPSGSLKFHWAELLKLGGLLYAEVTPQNMTMTFFDSFDKLLYKYSMSPRK